MSFANPFSDVRAHPFQAFLSALAGAFVPGGGFASHALFNAYNNHNFNNAMGTSFGNQQAQGDAAAQGAMDRPLSGVLGTFGDNSSPGGSYGGGAPNGNYDFGGGINYTGNGTGLFDQMQDSSTNGLFDFGSNNSMFVPDYGMAGDVASGVYGGQHMSPTQRRDYRDGLPMNQNVGNYGVSNFMANGQNVIFGSGDPNGRYRNRGYDYGG
jgi:hypothetical protein